MNCKRLSLYCAAALADRTGRAVAAVRATHGRDLAVAPAAGTGQIAVLRPDHALAGAFGTHGLALAVPTGSAGNSAHFSQSCMAAPHHGKKVVKRRADTVRADRHLHHVGLDNLRDAARSTALPRYVPYCLIAKISSRVMLPTFAGSLRLRRHKTLRILCV